MTLLRHMTLVGSAPVYKPTRWATRIDNPSPGRKRHWKKGAAMPLSEKNRERLTAVSTATLTTVLFKRGFRNTFIQGIHRLNPGGPAMVGPAYTLRYIPAREDLDHLGVFEGRSHPAARGRGRLPPRPCLRDRQPSHRVGRLRRRDSGHAAVEARRSRHRHRRRFARLAPDRAHALSRLSRRGGGADQPDQ